MDVAHRLEDGGGRPLGYVSMSRGRQCNTVHVVADSVDQAVEDLTRDWAVDHRARWAIDSGTPATDPLAVEHHDRAPAGMRAALHHARLHAERDAVAAAIPPDLGTELAGIDHSLAARRQDRTDLLTGHGRYAGTSEGEAAQQLIHARHQRADAERHADSATGWRDRRHWTKEAARWSDQETAAQTAYDPTAAPEAHRLDEIISGLEGHRDQVHAAQRERTEWLAQHPEAARRLHQLDRELNPLPDLPEVIRDLGRTQAAGIRRDAAIQPPAHDHGIELDFGP